MENSQEHGNNKVIYICTMQLNKIKSSIKSSTLLLHINKQIQETEKYFFMLKKGSETLDFIKILPAFVL